MEILHHGEIYVSILYMFILISSLCPKTLQIFTSKMTGIGTYRNAGFWYVFHIYTVGQFDASLQPGWDWYLNMFRFIHKEEKYKITLPCIFSPSRHLLYHTVLLQLPAGFKLLAAQLQHKSVKLFQVNSYSPRPRWPYIARCSSRMHILKPYSLKDSI